MTRTTISAAVVSIIATACITLKSQFEDMASTLTVTTFLTDEGNEYINLLAAHSPNVMTWEVAPDGKVIDRVEIKIEMQDADLTTYLFEVTGIEDEDAVAETYLYRFDFMDVFKILATQNIVDDFQINNFPYYELDEGKLTHRLDIEITAYYDDASTNVWNELNVYTIINGVKQVAGEDHGSHLYPYEADNNNPFILLPRPVQPVVDLNEEVNLTVFKGYPLEVAFIMSVGTAAPGGENYSLNIGASSFPFNSVPYADETALMRIAISLGNSELIGMTGGQKFLMTIEDHTTRVRNIRTEVVDKHVIYFKWLNSLGTWSYWGFDCTGVEEHDIKTVLRYGEVIDTMRLRTSNFNVSGKEKERSLTVYGSHLSKEQFDFVREIGESIAVYLWTGDKGEAFQLYKWLRVDVDKVKFRAAEIARTYKVEFDVIYPDQYVQSH